MVILGASTPLGSALVAACAAGGGRPVALVRTAAPADRLRALGGEPVIVDPAQGPRAVRAALAGALRQADALVLAAGTGGGAGSPPRPGPDGRPAALFAGAGERAGVRRYLMVSNWHGAEGQPWSERERAAYLAAKTAAEDDVRGRDLDWTIVRTGRLTDAPQRGRVRLRAAVANVAPGGEIGRADVAAAVLALLDRSAGFGRTLELTSGSEPLRPAVDAVCGPGGD
ncbi:NAD(P)H-binding protein [Streptomyces axinellae]|uniref:NAD(P)H-binding protein n=2 Tax=Streptomyces axinellae TaxID=552788 RepID=A0ABN3Q628_9ACTN